MQHKQQSRCRRRTSGAIFFITSGAMLILLLYAVSCHTQVTVFNGGVNQEIWGNLPEHHMVLLQSMRAPARCMGLSDLLRCVGLSDLISRDARSKDAAHLRALGLKQVGLVLVGTGVLPISLTEGVLETPPRPHDQRLRQRDREGDK